MSISSLRISGAIQGIQSVAKDLGTVSFPFALTSALSLANGTAANQADMVWTDTRTLAASTGEDLDLAGVLTDAVGATMTFATIKAVMITAASGNTNNVVVSRPAANGVVLFEAASDAIAVKPGGVFIWACPGTGVAVTAATGDLLHVENSAAGTSVDYSIIIIGTSA